jgi:H/ACA ribonucleoprotein complex subunit 3
MFKCPDCGGYTFGKTCKECDVSTINPLPARYSPQDRYGKYRRALKKSKGV